MSEQRPALLALDFDGVICDGLIEYFQTAWQAYTRIWTPANSTSPDQLASRFYKLRPVVETGWEMPVLLRALLMGASEDEVLQQWAAMRQQYIDMEGLDADAVMAQVDGVRDEWIARDLEDWLAQHRFYPGVIERLKSLLLGSIEVAIVTTKEGRFVKQLLKQEGIALSDDQIFGKEVGQPKHQTLRQLYQTLGLDRTSDIWFIEDRLKTLQNIQKQPDLKGITLFLADWGYNTALDRQDAQQDPEIHLISLQQFSQDFDQWCST